MEFILLNLFYSGLFFAVVWCGVVFARSKPLAISLLALGLLGLVLFGMTWGKMTWVVCGLLALAAAHCHWSRWKAAVTIVTFILLMGILRAGYWHQTLNELRQLQAANSAARLNDRLALLTRIAAPPLPRKSVADEILAESDEPASAIDFHNYQPTLQAIHIDPAKIGEAYPGHWDGRKRMLQSLADAHSAVVIEFHRRDGFGVVRTIGMWPRQEVLDLPEPEPLPQPKALPPTDTGSPLPLAEDLKSFPDAEEFQQLHVGSQLNFIAPKSMGHVVRRVPESDEHESLASWAGPHGHRPTPQTAATPQVEAYGFQGHAFRTMPQLPKSSGQSHGWRVVEVELVSLLKDNSPAVYQSDLLPNLETFTHDDVPTRPLDRFERDALSQLREGKDFVYDQRANEIRAMGSLRMIRECMACHEGESDSLLGAFTYRLTRNPAVAPKNEPAQILSFWQPPRDDVQRLQ